MKHQPAALVGLLGLVACQPVGTPGELKEYEMEVKGVELPASIGPSAALDVVVEVTVGGCTSFKRIEATRTASSLTLKAIGNTPSNPLTPCPASIGWEKHPYTDPGTPTRTNPFEVIVNSKSWGTVEVK